MKNAGAACVLGLAVVLAITGCTKSVSKVHVGRNGSYVITEDKALRGRHVTAAKFGAPVYPGAVVEENIGLYYKGGDSIKSDMIALSTPDSFNTVLSFYKSRFSGAKLQQLNNKKGQFACLQIAGKKGVRSSLQIARFPGSNKTLIMVTKYK